MSDVSITLNEALEKRSKSEEMHWKIQMVMELLTGHGSASADRPLSGVKSRIGTALILQQLDGMHINR